MYIYLPRSEYASLHLDARLGSVLLTCEQSGKQSEVLKSENCLFLIGSAQLGRVIPLAGSGSTISTILQNFALQPTLLKMRPARRIWKTSSSSRTFTSSAARLVKPSATDRAESAYNTEGLNRYSRTVTQPKDQGASQVKSQPSNQNFRPSEET